MSLIRTTYIFIALVFLSCKAEPDDFIYEKNLFNGIELATAQNKPILVHFTGYAIRHNEFMDVHLRSYRLQKLLKEQFITVQLYVDDSKKFTTSDTMGLHRIISSPDGLDRIGKARRVGNINSALQIELLRNNTQPQYLILDNDLNFLVEPYGYTRKDSRFFISKLKEGLKNYKAIISK
jgi:thiol:disulfide interchange protein DsbD